MSIKKNKKEKTVKNVFKKEPQNVDAMVYFDSKLWGNYLTSTVFIAFPYPATVGDKLSNPSLIQ